VDVEGVLSGRGGDRPVRSLLLGAGRAPLRALLDSMAGGSGTVRGCRLRRAQLKPGRKLTAYHDVLIAGDPRPVPVVVTWHSGGVPEGAAERAAAAEATLRAAGLPARLPRLWAVDRAAGMIVLAAPLDPAFPALARLSDPASVPETLARCGEEAVPAAGCGVRPLRYRPGQRHVLEYLGPRRLRLFVKLYRPGEGAPVAGAVGVLAALLEESGVPGLHAVRPAAVLGDGDALVYREVAGAALSRSLGAGCRPDPAHLERVGLMLRAVHAATPAPPSSLPGRELAAEVRTVGRACEAMAALRPDLGALAAATVERAWRAIAALEQEPATTLHGDMKADHLLWGPGGLQVLDTDRCSLGDPAYDLGKMLADLRFWAAVTGSPAAAGAERAVLAAYAGGEPRVARARLYAALLLVRMAARRVPLWRPDWAPRTAALLASAAAAVDG
jgi:hypothetical protein